MRSDAALPLVAPSSAVAFVRLLPHAPPPAPRDLLTMGRLFRWCRRHWPGPRVSSDAQVAATAVLSPDALVADGAIVGEHTFVRGGSVLGARSIVGHGSEVARSIVFPGARLAHKATVTDAIVGSDANLSAACTVGSLSLFQISEVLHRGVTPDLLRRPVVIGDRAVIGASAVLGPGTYVGPDSIIYPGVVLGSVSVPAQSVVKLRQHLDITERRPH